MKLKQIIRLGKNFYIITVSSRHSSFTQLGLRERKTFIVDSLLIYSSQTCLDLYRKLSKVKGRKLKKIKQNKRLGITLHNYC